MASEPKSLPGYSPGYRVVHHPIAGAYSREEKRASGPSWAVLGRYRASGGPEKDPRVKKLTLILLLLLI